MIAEPCLNAFARIACASLLYALPACAEEESSYVTRISTMPDGSEPSEASKWPEFSKNGRFVLFHSGAELDGTPNDYGGLYAYGLETGDVEAVSPRRGEFLVASSAGPKALADAGNVVVFASSWELLENVNGNNHAKHLYLYYRDSGKLTAADRGLYDEIAPRGSSEMAISADGRFLAFAADYPESEVDIVAEHTMMFVRDMDRGSTEYLPPFEDGPSTARMHRNPQISKDGRYVAFTAHIDGGGAFIGIADREARTTKRISNVHPNFNAWGPQYRFSPDGQWLVGRLGRLGPHPG